MIGVGIAVLVTFAILVYAAEPALSARIAGRPMSRLERDRFIWGALAVAMALGLLAVLIGTA